MPRPEQTPELLYEGLPYGQNALINDQAPDVQDEQGQPGDELVNFQPSSPEESFLFSPTDRPTEPVTAGMGFGAGPDIARATYSGPDQFKAQIRNQLAAQPEQPKEVRAFIQKLDRGY